MTLGSIVVQEFDIDSDKPTSRDLSKLGERLGDDATRLQLVFSSPSSRNDEAGHLLSAGGTRCSAPQLRAEERAASQSPALTLLMTSKSSDFTRPMSGQF